MTTYACIVCGRPFSEDAIRAAVLRRHAEHAHALYLEHTPEAAEDFPLCEDHGLKHLDTPETRKVFGREYLDAIEYQAGEPESEERIRIAEQALRGAQARVAKENYRAKVRRRGRVIR